MLWLLLACGDKDTGTADTADCTEGFLDGDSDGHGSGEHGEWCDLPVAAEGGDCDDSNPAIHPLAAEVCGDGADNDCDSLADCTDDDCSEDISCREVCSDGLDNDLDGLTDCEDGDCTWHSACIEDCDDGLDDDGDGLTDCEDDDCLWTLECDHPGGLKITLQGGDGALNILQRLGIYHYNVYTTHLFQTSTLVDVHGIVQVLPEGQPHWSTATSTITCGWSIEKVENTSLRTQSWWGTFEHHGGELTRTGFSIEEGCRLDDPRFLPSPVFHGKIPIWTATYSIWVAGFYDWYNRFSTHTATTTSWPDRTSGAYTLEGGLIWYQQRALAGELTGSPTHFRLPGDHEEK